MPKLRFCTQTFAHNTTFSLLVAILELGNLQFAAAVLREDTARLLPNQYK